jgi:hypothetical protein
MSDVNLVCAGRVIPDAKDRIRRYCGLVWSGGEPETWAYEYYDSIPTDPSDLITPADIIPSFAVSPGSGQAGRDRALFFKGRGGAACEEWLAALPRDVDLADVDEPTLRTLAELPSISGGIGLAVVSKVTHRKRPRLIPLFDRALVDRYRQVTGLRGEAAWSALLNALRLDLSIESNRSFLAETRAELADELAGPVPSDLRLTDIAIWMAR